MKITETYSSNEDSDFKKRVAEINEKYQAGEVDILRLDARNRVLGESIIEYKPISDHEQKMRKAGYY